MPKEMSQAEFERQLAANELENRRKRLEDEPPIGAGPHGDIVVLRPEDRAPADPIIVGPPEEDISDIDDYDDLVGG